MKTNTKKQLISLQGKTRKKVKTRTSGNSIDFRVQTLQSLHHEVQGVLGAGIKPEVGCDCSSCLHSSACRVGCESLSMPQHNHWSIAHAVSTAAASLHTPCSAHHRLRAHQATPDAAATAWQAIDAHVFAACVGDSHLLQPSSRVLSIIYLIVSLQNF